MNRRDPVRLVYSTAAGRVCATCGWPIAPIRGSRSDSPGPPRECKCSSKNNEEKVPSRPAAKLRIEKNGRGGKSVTVIDGLPRNSAFLEELAKELKKALGTGGAVKDVMIELQGDRRERLRELLAARGFTVKG